MQIFPYPHDHSLFCIIHTLVFMVPWDYSYPADSSYSSVLPLPVFASESLYVIQSIIWHIREFTDNVLYFCQNLRIINDVRLDCITLHWYPTCVLSSPICRQMNAMEYESWGEMILWWRHGVIAGSWMMQPFFFNPGTGSQNVSVMLYLKHLICLNCYLNMDAWFLAVYIVTLLQMFLIKCAK